MKLSDVQCRKAAPREKAYKMADGQGLYLHVSSTGHKSWRLKYRFGGKEKLLTIGPYPEVSLGDARDACSASSSAGWSISHGSCQNDSTDLPVPPDV